MNLFNQKCFPKSGKNIRSLAEDLRPIALTSVLAKVQESFAVRWIYEDTEGKISDSQLWWFTAIIDN
jgi:hypothetical protein